MQLLGDSLEVALVVDSEDVCGAHASEDSGCIVRNVNEELVMPFHHPARLNEYKE